MTTTRATMLTACVGLSFGLAGAASAQDASGPLASYFGFQPLRVLVVDQNAGPAMIADVNADGLDDMVVVNNSKSRLEFHLQRATPRTDTEMERDFEPNELAPSPYFDREFVTLQHQVTSFTMFDHDGDGALDLVYAGRPSEIVTMSQVSPMRFEITSRRRVRDLSAGVDGLAIANVMGNRGPELRTRNSGREASNRNP